MNNLDLPLSKETLEVPRILIVIDGGMATAFVEGKAEVLIIDYDTDGVEDDQLTHDPYDNPVLLGSVATRSTDRPEDFQLMFEYFLGSKKENT